MTLYPVSLSIAGRRCVVVGGGDVAARKVAVLAECGAAVVVVSPELCSDLEESARRGGIDVIRREYEQGDLDGALLAIAATNDAGVNKAVAGDARNGGVLVNVVDAPDLCDFYVPATVRRGGFQIAVGTGGASPALASGIRKELEGRFGPEYGPFVELLARLREELRVRVPDRDRRSRIEEDFIVSPALALLASGETRRAEEILREYLARAEEGDDCP